MITAEAQLRAGIVPLCSKPSRDARLGARRKRFHPLTAPAPRRRGGVGTKGVPTFRPRLRRIEQRAFRLLKALDAAREATGAVLEARGAELEAAGASH